MRYFVGTSGYSYTPWRGSFYPEKLPQKQMLGYYAQRFSAVEINNTFYRMPTVSLVESWAGQAPGSFQFAVKAPQAITHFKRLKDATATVQQFVNVVSALKKRQGPLLFQLPSNFKKDLPRLEAFLGSFADKRKWAFEFRHQSWLDEEVFECLRSHSCALCMADTEDSPPADVVSTASWGYIRLRREGYTDKQLSKWIDQLGSQGWHEAYIFFKHEDTGTGPKLAARFLELAGRV